MPKTNSETIREFADSQGVALKVDREKGIIHGVKILGSISKNGRTYAESAIAKAKPLYEGALSNVNHVKAGESVAYENRIGVMRNVQAKSDGLYADFHFNPKHALAEQLIWDAENAPAKVGFSHDVQAKTSRGKDGKVVIEEISRVASVDLVANPATTNGLYESQIEETHMGIELEDLTVEQLREHRGDLVAKLTGTDETSKLSAQVAKLTEDLKAVTQERDTFKTKESEHAKTLAIMEELKAVKLDASDKVAVSESFMAQLKIAPDAAGRKQLIEDRMSLLKLAARSPITSAAPLGATTVTEGSVGPGANVKETLDRLRN